VLVPGFVGFDALGQLEYYAGVTEVFDRFREDREASHVVLHYFDNFPTASVALRAELLQSWIAKRVARGQIGPDDRVALVGHSTGGLDIRKALHEFGRGGTLSLDGSHVLDKRDVLARIKHVVFLSTPQFGTNLGDFGHRLAATLQALIKDAGIAVRLNREPISSLRRLLVELLPDTRSGVLLALADTLSESDEDSSGSEAQRAQERDARSQVSLWLEHMGKDFGIIDDLRSFSAPRLDARSPAHFDTDQRAEELATWRRSGISTCSFVTRVSAVQVSPIASSIVALLKSGAPVFNGIAELVNLAAESWWLPFLSLPAIAGRAAGPALAVPAVIALLYRHPAVLFEAMHALCADPTGPFKDPSESAPQGLAPRVRALGSNDTLPASELRISDSDGVVNSVSMLWPFEKAHPADHPMTLVEADHGDIIGHYEHRKKREPAPNGRKYYAYDIFPSGAGFTREKFEAVWQQVFSSCL
jgi:hypothetical protein